MTFAETFFITLGFTVILFYWVWIFAVRIKNFSIIDAAWAGAFTLHALFFYASGVGSSSRRFALLAMVAAWSVRLCYFLAKRISGHHPQEDTRYQQLRTEYGSDYEKRFLRFFLFQAVSVSALTLPMIFVFNNSNENLGLTETVAVICFLLSLLGEALADAQMAKFKSKPENKGKVCNIGLWRLSRHPNYFFESCIWFSFYIFCLGTDGLWWAIYAPSVILFLLLKVTGVPPSEAQSLKSRGDAYREYQRRTSIFVPWFPKD